jgi:hypothetical protein
VIVEHSRKQRTLLIVAYDFPPINSAGMYRITSIVRHLSRRNWQPTVATVKDSFVERSDDTFRLVPDNIRVIRTSNFELLRLKKRMVRRGKPASPAKTVIPLSALPGRSRMSRLRTLLSRVLVLEHLLSFPDRKAGWFFPLIYRLRSLLRKERFDIVFSSSPPHSMQFAILVLRKLVPFVWVSDFRDPWTIPARGGNGLSRAVQTWMEKQVLRNSDAIIANTEGNKAALEAHFGGAVRGKITVITNGFDDAEQFAGGSTPSGVRDADLVYTGAIYRGMLRPYVAAMEHLLREGTHELPRLHVYGAVPWYEDGSVVEREVAERIVFKGRVSYEESLRVMTEARALLLLLPQGDEFATWVPSKLYAYLLSSAPILALAPEGDATRVLRETGRGVVVSSVDSASIAKEIVTFMDGLKKGNLPLQPNHGKIREYSWASLSARLEGVLLSHVSDK